MQATLYSLALSHPAIAVRRMLELKGIEHRVVQLPPGFHPPVLRLRGFSGSTVPALTIDGRRIQGSLEISRALEELVPEPPLFPADPARRRAVEEAERWGEAEVQSVPRRIFRWLAANRYEVRRWLAHEHVPIPNAIGGALARAPMQARAFARAAGADEAAVRADLAALPALLDRVQALRAEGTLGDDPPNAADLQIGASIRALDKFADVGALIGDHPAVRWARELFPGFPAGPPAALPDEWLAAVRPASG